MNWIYQLTVEVISFSSVAITILTFFGILIYCRINAIEIELQELIKRALSASAIPTSMVILLCSVELSLLQKLAGLLQVYIALAGLCLAYISVLSLCSPFNKPGSK